MTDDNTFYIGTGAAALTVLGVIAYATLAHRDPDDTSHAYREGYYAAHARRPDNNPYSAYDAARAVEWSTGYKAGTNFLARLEEVRRKGL